MAPEKPKAGPGKCTTGKNHQYGADDICTVCGYENKTRKYWKLRKESTPKREGKGPGVARTKQSIVLLISGAQSMIVGLNPELEEDALSPQEIGALADVLGDEINESATLKRWVATAGKQSTHIRLVVVLIMILAPRLARRGIIPNGAEQIAEAASISMAAGGTPDGDRGDELGQEYAGGGGPPDEAPVPDRDTNEDGPLPPPDPISSGNGHEARSDDLKSTVRTRRTKAKV